MFYEDFLVLGEDGYFIFFPSVSPENSPGNFVPEEYDALTHPLPTTINATMDFAICKELLSNLIEGCQKVKAYLDQIDKWKSILNRIPPYQVNNDGAIKEWMHPDFEDNYNHRHLSHIYPVFPGHEIKGGHKLFERFKVAVEKRLGIGLSDQSGWSLAHLANIYARLEDGEKALECLDLLARSCVMKNFLCTHNDWRDMGICLRFDPAPFQIDANMGWVSAVQEMLLYSDPDLVKILPACPQRWGKGSVKDFHFCTGKISFSWDIEQCCFHAEICAKRTTDILLKLPERFGRYDLSCSDARANIVRKSEMVYEVKMESGSKIIVINIT